MKKLVQQPDDVATEEAPLVPDAPVGVAATAQTAHAERLIYLGPNLQGGRLSRFTVFRGGLPAYLQDLTGKYPEIERLTVPVEQMADFSKKIDEVGTAEAEWFASLKGAK